ncbi:MAG: TetR/AcrR family transcriptional regulator [Acidimicrobiales bacterium]
MTKIVSVVNMALTTSRAIADRLRVIRDGDDDLTAAQRQARERLLTTATDHFARFGYRKASIGAIAIDAGVGKGTVYLHFESKKSLLVACIANEKLRIMPEVEHMFTLEGPQRLESFLRTSVQFVVTSPLSSAILRGDRELEAILADMDPTEWSDDEAGGKELVVDMIQAAAPGLGEREAQDLAEVVRVAVLLPAHLPVAGVPVPSDRFVDSYVKLLARGVEALSPAHGDANQTKPEGPNT